MIISTIYRGLNMVSQIWHRGKLIFQREAVTFHVVEDGKLIILGALTAVNSPDGVYLDCSPDWVYPVQNGNSLIIEQVYKATQNGNVLEVE